MRTRRGESSTSDATSSTAANGDGSKVRRHSHGGNHKSLLATVWTLIKTVFFTIVHIYKSLTAFWSQMHVCMLPALGELDNEEGEGQQDQLDEEDTQQLNQATSAGSPKRKRAAKEL